MSIQLQPVAAPSRCPLCSAKVERTGKVGRPRDYCSDACRETAKLIGRLSSHLDAVRARGLDADGEAAIRRRVWSLVNATLNKRIPRAAAKSSTSDDVRCGSLSATA